MTDERRTGYGIKCGWTVIVMWLVLAAGGRSAADPETGFVIVTGDRVSLRAEPDLNAVLMGRAMSGDRLALHDASDAQWAGVQAPASIDVWVSGAYIQNGVVQTERLNIRSGPSLSHSVVGVIEEGREVAVRGQVADWLKIAPTPECTVWISRDFSEVTLPETVEPVEPPEVPVEIEEVAASDPEPDGPTVRQVLAAAETMLENRRMRLRPDPEKEQGVEGVFEGLLKPASGLLYRLVDPEDGTVRCYVRGNVRQMEIFSHLPLRVTGKVYRAEGIGFPIVVPLQIKKLEEGRQFE